MGRTVKWGTSLVAAIVVGSIAGDFYRGHDYDMLLFFVIGVVAGAILGTVVNHHYEETSQ